MQLLPVISEKKGMRWVLLFVNLSQHLVIQDIITYIEDIITY